MNQVVTQIEEPWCSVSKPDVADVYEILKERGLSELAHLAHVELDERPLLETFRAGTLCWGADVDTKVEEADEHARNSR